MIVNASLQDKKSKPQTKAKSLLVERVPFVKQANLNSLSDLSLMGEADIIEICSQFPKAAANLIIDLYQAWGFASADYGKARADADECKRLLGEECIKNDELKAELRKLKEKA